MPPRKLSSFLCCQFVRLWQRNGLLSSYFFTLMLPTSFCKCDFHNPVGRSSPCHPEPRAYDTDQDWQDPGSCPCLLPKIPKSMGILDDFSGRVTRNTSHTSQCWGSFLPLLHINTKPGLHGVDPRKTLLDLKIPLLPHSDSDTSNKHDQMGNSSSTPVLV